MDVLYPCCAGLDVHQKTVVACLIRSQGEEGETHVEVRTYSTTTPQLKALLAWLLEEGCPTAAMESTGELWKPIWNLLEGHLDLWLVNARHVKAVPGRKTDVRDAQWLAELLRHGLLKRSFVPEREERELRELTRQRTHLVEERARVVNRLQAVLESANIKLTSVLTDVVGTSGKAMLTALSRGEADPEMLAGLAHPTLSAKREELVAALTGAVREHHRFLLKEGLEHLTFLEGQLAGYNQEIERRLSRLSAKEESGSGSGPAGGGEGEETQTAPGSQVTERLTYHEARSLLVAIPGIAERAATTILAEMGVRLSQFPSDRHLVSWAGLAPGRHQSAGKRRPCPVTPGNAALRQVLIQAAHGAARTKRSYFHALYHRLATRRGKKRALVAVARSLLVVIYHVLLRREAYQELGADYFDRRDRERLMNRLVHRLEGLGFAVSLQPQPATAS